MSILNTLRSWTPPYYGVSHRETERYLCTVVTHEDRAEAVCYRKPVRIADGVDRVFATPREARAWCDQVIAGEVQP